MLSCGAWSNLPLHGRKESEALRWVARQWGSWTEKDVISDVDIMLSVTKEQTLAGRLLQMAGAAVWKPRVPSDKLHRIINCITLS